MKIVRNVQRILKFMASFFSPGNSLFTYLFGSIFLTVVTGVGGLGAQPSPITPNKQNKTCQIASECFQLAVGKNRTMNGETDEVEKTISRLQEIQSRFPHTDWARRAKIHLGLLLTKTDPEGALKNFRDALEDSPILADYLQFWMGTARLEARDFLEAAQMFEAVVEHEPGSLLKNDALVMGGKAYFLAGQCQSAVPLFLEALEAEPESLLAPQTLLNLGKCQLDLKQTQAARATFRELWWRFPTKPEAETAFTLLDQHHLMQEQGPTLEERFRRGLAFYNEASFANAVSELQQYVRDAPAGPQYFEAQYKLGLAFARLKQYDQAERVFQGLSTSNSPQAGIATVWLGRVYLRQNKGSALLALQNQPSFRRSTGDQQALIYVFSGIWLEDEGKYDKALQFFRQAVEVGRSSQRRLDALWRIGWRYYQLEEYALAISTFEDMRSIPKDGEEHARATYWMARAMGHLKKKAKAQVVYEELAERLPFTYYGQLARSRLSQPTPASLSVFQETTSRAPRSQETWRLLKDLHYRKAEELIGLNLFQAAAQELHSLIENFSWDKDALSHFLELARQAHAYDIGIRLSIERFGGELSRGRIPPSSEVWRWAYPVGYLSTIRSFVKPEIDPYLIAGLIREESLYNPFAVSRVGALGLMQLMPATADKVARQLGRSTPETEELFDAEANIQLGTAYVNELFQRFQGNIIHTVAAYNAGPPAVKRWIARNGHQRPDEFVESISYRETRGYVKRVLGSFRIYRSLDGEP